MSERATMAEIRRLRAEVEALRGAMSWVDPMFITGRTDAEIVQRVSFANQDVRRFDTSNGEP